MKSFIKNIKIALFLGVMVSGQSYGAQLISRDVEFTSSSSKDLKAREVAQGLIDHGKTEVWDKDGFCQVEDYAPAASEYPDFFVLNDAPFEIPAYDQLDWGIEGSSLKNGALIQKGALWYQIILPQRFALLDPAVTRKDLKIDSFDHLSPKLEDITFFKEVMGGASYALAYYELRLEADQCIRMPILFGKDLNQEDLETFHKLREKFLWEILKRQGTDSFNTKAKGSMPSLELPRLSPMELRSKLLLWLSYKTPYYLIASKGMYEHAQEKVPLFWRVKTEDRPNQDIIVTSPINDLTGDEDPLRLALKGNLTFSHLWWAVIDEVKDLGDVSSFLIPLGLTQTMFGTAGNHWNLLHIKKKVEGWDVVNYDPKSYFSLHTPSVMAHIVGKELGDQHSFAVRYLGHQGIANTTDCGYYVLTYIQFYLHGLSVEDVSQDQITNQFSLWM